MMMEITQCQFLYLTKWQDYFKVQSVEHYYIKRELINIQLKVELLFQE